MTTINRIAEWNNQTFQNMQIKQLDRRTEDLRLQEIRVKSQISETERARLEMNKRMNRAGQNVDKMA
jgi:hypothetical protein